MEKRSFKQLNYDDRVVICHLARQGCTVSEIASQLNRSKSTISRELKRNRLNSGHYYPLTADRKMRERKVQRRLLLENKALLKEVVLRLKQTHSPEQIANRLALIKGCKVISYETIYRFIYSDVGREYRLWRYLRFNKRPYRKRQGVRGSRALIPDRVGIEHRPVEVNQRQVFGHWECDLMHFKQGIQSNVLVLRERQTRYLLSAVNIGKSAKPIAQQIIRLLAPLPAQAVQSITYDNGLEFSAHPQVKHALNVQNYFCEPYKSYQKGSVEQANLWLRERFPRTTDNSDINDLNVAAWVDLMNNRPLKCLAYQTPAERFNQQLRSVHHA